MPINSFTQLDFSYIKEFCPFHRLGRHSGPAARQVGDPGGGGVAPAAPGHLHGPAAPAARHSAVRTPGHWQNPYWYEPYIKTIVFNTGLSCV